MCRNRCVGGLTRSNPRRFTQESPAQTEAAKLAKAAEAAAAGAPEGDPDQARVAQL